LEGRHANVLDLLNGHVGVEGGDRVPAALVADTDVDARLADAEAHERLALLEDIVAGFRGGRFAESLFDDGRIDPGDRGAGGSTGHQCTSLFIRRLVVALRELGSGISVSFRLGHALESEAEPVRIRYFHDEELEGIQGRGEELGEKPRGRKTLGMLNLGDFRGARGRRESPMGFRGSRVQISASRPISYLVSPSKNNLDDLTGFLRNGVRTHF
jgi:hypothetical protein